jgi:putative ABC transport system substrate-binding protein
LPPYRCTGRWAISIVFQNGGDPIASGLVENLNHPGGNLTGVNVLAPALIAKRLELLHEAVPQARVIATLINPKARNAEPNIEASKTAPAALGLQLIILKASTNQEIDAAFAELSRRPIGALLVGTDIFLSSSSRLPERTSMATGTPRWCCWPIGTAYVRLKCVIFAGIRSISIRPSCTSVDSNRELLRPIL